MTRTLQTSAFFVVLVSLALTTSYNAADIPWRPEIKLVSPANLPGSFVSPQAIYADSERVFACSYQGDLFILERDRQGNFPWIQTINVGAPLTAVRGDDDYLYVTGRDGNLHVFSKTWPVQFLQSVPLSSYGLAAVEVVGANVYVAKGQAAMTASKDRLYLSGLNPGDAGLEVPSMRSYGEQFVPGRTLVFDRQTLQLVGIIPNSDPGAVRVTVWQNFVYFTKPGCCGVGIDIYDAVTLKPVQFINRSTNAVAGIKRKGMSLLAGGSEAGNVDLYQLGTNSYDFASTVDLRALTGFTGSEDIEIRSLWIDGLDDLIFAGSSWGNDQSRSSNLPSLFVLEIR